MFFRVILLQKHLVDDFVLGAFSVCACILVTLYYITRNKGRCLCYMQVWPGEK